MASLELSFDPDILFRRVNTSAGRDRCSRRDDTHLYRPAVTSSDCSLCYGAKGIVMESQYYWEAVSHIHRIEETCGTVRYRTDGRPFRYRCRSRLCPNCMEWRTWLTTPVKERAAALYDRLINGLDDPGTCNWLYVTIDMVAAELVDGPLADYARRFKAAFKKALDRGGARDMDVRCLMFCHIPTKVGSDDSKLHWHGWIGGLDLTEDIVRAWMPYQSKDGLVTRIYFDDPYDSQNLTTSLQFGLRYAIRIDSTPDSRQAVTETFLGVRGGAKGGGDRFEYGLRKRVTVDVVEERCAIDLASEGSYVVFELWDCPLSHMDHIKVTARPAGSIMAPVSPCRRGPPSFASA